MNRRARASGLHFLFSAVVALLSALIVFLVWYPPPYANLAGGLTLFAMVVGIDVILGPFLTAVVASPTKPRLELRRDISLIVLMQFLAFGYGMYTIAVARPVHLVFEADRFQVVSAADIEPEQLANAAEPYRQLPWTGPTLMGTRKSANQAEMTRSLDLGLQGLDVAMQPDRWVSYESISDEVLKKARPANLLLVQYPERSAELKELAAKSGVTLEDLKFLPVMARKASAVSLIMPPGARIVGYLCVDGFF